MESHIAKEDLLWNTEFLSMTAQDCINYALSLPTHCIALGFTSLDHVEDDVRAARQYKPLSTEQMDQLRARAAKVAGPDLEDWKNPLQGLTT